MTSCQPSPWPLPLPNCAKRCCEHACGFLRCYPSQWKLASRSACNARSSEPLWHYMSWREEGGGGLYLLTVLGPCPPIACVACGWAKLLYVAFAPCFWTDASPAPHASHTCTTHMHHLHHMHYLHHMHHMHQPHASPTCITCTACITCTTCITHMHRPHASPTCTTCITCTARLPNPTLSLCQSTQFIRFVYVVDSAQPLQVQDTHDILPQHCSKQAASLSNLKTNLFTMPHIISTFLTKQAVTPYRAFPSP